MRITEVGCEFPVDQTDFSFMLSHERYTAPRATGASGDGLGGEWMAGAQLQDWHHEDIKAALRKRHRSLEALAKAWGYSSSAIRVALNPGSRWPGLEARIAAELDVAPHILWPDRWNPDGTRRPPSIATEDSPPAQSLHRQIERAA